MAATQEERTALALAALAEVTDPGDVGELLAVEEAEPGVIDLRFATTLPAYAGWHWTVSTSDLPDQHPTVLEVELLPGDGALLAPPWVPWAERLAEWRRQHPDERHPGEADDAGDDENGDDEDLDEDDLSGDDGLDELDDADLEGEESPEEAEQDSGDLSDEDDDADEDREERDSDDERDSDGADDDLADDDSDDEDSDDERVRPALEDRSL